MPLRFTTKLIPNAPEYDQPFIDNLSRIDMFTKMAGWLVKTSRMITYGEKRAESWHNLADALRYNSNMRHGDVNLKLKWTAKALDDISEKWRNMTAKHCNTFFSVKLERFVEMKVGKLLGQVMVMEDCRQAWVKSVEMQSDNSDGHKEEFLLLKQYAEKLMEDVKTEMDELREGCYGWIAVEKDFGLFVSESLSDVAEPPPDAYYEEMFAWKKEKEEKKSDKVMRKKGVSCVLPDRVEKSEESEKSIKSGKSSKYGKMEHKMKNKKESLKKKLGELKYMIGGADGFKKSKKGASKMSKPEEGFDE